MAFSETGGFEPKKALEEWKKAKPLTMKETGVGELLRALPESPAPGQLGKYTEIQGKLKQKLADPNIKKESKAVKCITSISDDITSYLKWYKNSRAHVIANMNEIMKEIRNFQSVLEKMPDQPDKVRQVYSSTLMTARKYNVDSRSYPPSGRSIFPPNVGGAWQGVTNHWSDQAQVMLKELEKKPAPDLKSKEITDRIQMCKTNANRVAAVINLLPPI